MNFCPATASTKRASSGAADAEGGRQGTFSFVILPPPEEEEGRGVGFARCGMNRDCAVCGVVASEQAEKKPTRSEGLSRAWIGIQHCRN